MKVSLVLILAACVVCISLAEEVQTKHSQSESEGKGHEGKGAKASEGAGDVSSGKSSSHHHDSAKKGQHTKDLHKTSHLEKKGKKSSHHHEDSHKSSKHAAGGSHHGAKFVDGKKHKKGNYLKGFREKFHKDEEKKHDSFFSNGQKSGQYEVYGKKNSKFSTDTYSKKNKKNHKNLASGKAGGKSIKSTTGHQDADQKAHQGQGGSEGPAERNFFIIYGEGCPVNYTGFRGNEAPFELFVQENGNLYYNEIGSFENVYSLDHYCVDNFDKPISAVLCEINDDIDDAQGDKEANARRFNSYGMIVSMPFLMATFLVYLILPEKNLHRRALMSYVLSVFGGYSCLVALDFSIKVDSSLEESTIPCQITGYLIIFFFMVSFFWLNVMCIDMWLTFSSTISKNISELKKFIYSSIYTWGMSILFVLMVFLLNSYGDKEADYHPKIAVHRCFLEDGLASFYYFYLPMAILIGINFILFILTSLKIFKIKKETKVLKRTDSKIHSNDEAKQRFNLYLKLMFAMGVNWSMEFISFITGWICGEDKAPPAIFYLSDITNALYGLIIFLIFVFKKKTWRSLIKRYYVLIGKSYVGPISSSRRSTRISGYSTETVDSVDYHPCSSPATEKPNNTSL